MVMFARSVLLAVLLLAGCSNGYQEPPPNSIVQSFDARGRAVQLAISGLGPARAAALVAPDGARLPAAGISVLRGRTSPTTHRPASG